MFGKLEKQIVRQRVLNGEPRIDGRDLRKVRPISIEVGMLPKAHGSALFTRGETQAIVVATLGTLRDAAIIDALEGTYKDGFMLHYNFPPYSTGEAGMRGGPKRRDIGHGRLRDAVSRRIATAGFVPVHVAGRIGNHRIERLELDGERLWCIARR